MYMGTLLCTSDVSSVLTYAVTCLNALSGVRTLDLETLAVMDAQQVPTQLTRMLL